MKEVACYYPLCYDDLIMNNGNIRNPVGSRWLQLHISVEMVLTRLLFETYLKVVGRYNNAYNTEVCRE